MFASSESPEIDVPGGMEFDDCDVISHVYRLRVPGTAARLVNSGPVPEPDAVARGRAEYLQHVFERAEVELDRQDATEWVANYGRLIERVRAALDWAFSPWGDAAIGVGLTIATIPLWILCAQPSELCLRIERALASKAAATQSARELHLRAAGTLARMVYEDLAAEDSSTSVYEPAHGRVSQRQRRSGGPKAA